ncbi:hypothetical protein [Candidatus Poriferisodalis sp.]|uniref:hypothetical protein n=1 Tax=Candidatus Poriferisodalis sp. TaxID=3101277 RepID=UPI003B01BAE8
MAAPDLAAARRAADELVRAGAGRVLLFGSVARGDAGHHAGIDWDKEIGLPADPTAELASRFEEMYDAAGRQAHSARGRRQPVRQHPRGRSHRLAQLAARHKTRVLVVSPGSRARSGVVELLPPFGARSGYSLRRVQRREAASTI